MRYTIELDGASVTRADVPDGMGSPTITAIACPMRPGEWLDVGTYEASSDGRECAPLTDASGAVVGRMYQKTEDSTPPAD